mmetsp:Transcript_49690/g.140708  ORF Transcript_49690/g.140708 Transcript_49690/m.140708 type:complete len:89 (+) Transcript_49690:73-339(+)
MNRRDQGGGGGGGDLDFSSSAALRLERRHEGMPRAQGGAAVRPSHTLKSRHTSIAPPVPKSPTPPPVCGIDRSPCEKRHEARPQRPRR